MEKKESFGGAENAADLYGKRDGIKTIPSSWARYQSFAHEMGQKLAMAGYLTKQFNKS
ncbi:hypothetical protein CCACVL1_18060 [Corchorus capsularis]|uniref:Uncharacterized protein n=1 Tax=Corchorus capsularis TaxID=210143 RepID=A0A1R3HNN7_COCAP|nr:hypothetical protein CCACVL1_18060 [Corchorus capsularis]